MARRKGERPATRVAARIAAQKHYTTCPGRFVTAGHSAMKWPLKARQPPHLPCLRGSAFDSALLAAALAAACLGFLHADFSCRFCSATGGFVVSTPNAARMNLAAAALAESCGAPSSMAAQATLQCQLHA